MSGTPLIPGWYINFQAAVLKSLPRPGEIDQETAKRYEDNQARLKENLIEGLIAPRPVTPTTTEWKKDEDGNICFTVVSNGFTNYQWEDYLRRYAWHIGDRAERMLLNFASEPPTNGVVYNVVVYPSKNYNNNGGSIMMEQIRAVAKKRNWGKPHWEVACLVRNAFFDCQLKSMGFKTIVVMHEPFRIPDKGFPDGNLEVFSCHGEGAGRWLFDYGDPFPGKERNDSLGFAFIVP
ncbi:MAG: hypothetical protein QG665_443 [Patescibacteria group bacterium]|nr:hypothetical protein [Patescibacteria group bacterium]